MDGSDLRDAIAELDVTAELLPLAVGLLILGLVVVIVLI